MKTKIIVIGIAFVFVAYWLYSNKSATSSASPVTPPTSPPATGDSSDSGPALNITNF